MNHSASPATGIAGVTVAGCGYTGRRLLDICRTAGRDFLGLVRSQESLAGLRAAGARAEILDLDTPGGLLPAAWTQARAIVYMAPPPEAGETDPRLRNFLARLAKSPAALVYLSTTAVYGDAGGERVNESTPPAPGADRGRRRLDAEQAVLDFGLDAGVPVRVLRIPGIYGPGRLPVERIRQGMPVLRVEDAGPGNRIHVDDLAAVCLAAADYQGPERIFNVGDGNEASTTAYFRTVARLAGLLTPPELPLRELLQRVTPAMRGYLVERRLVETRRMREELGFVPRFAELEAGVAASLAEEGRSASSAEEGLG
jgi:nucleoside-diphosphate-sugar epimerase